MTTSDPDVLAHDTVLTVTDKARRHIAALRDERADEVEVGDGAEAFWIEVVGVQAADFTYDLYFQGAEHADPGDRVIEHDDLTVVVPATSVGPLRGAVLDLSRDLLHPGLSLDNPNRPEPQGGPVPEDDDLELSGSVEERVQQVLERRINPSIAGHGGRADLVSVEGGVVSLRLSGGCQGCGMAAATLRNGIEVRLREAVPEITEIVDVTDHEAGANPYY